MENKKIFWFIGIVTIAVLALIIAAYFVTIEIFHLDKISFIPPANATLNGLSFVSLLTAFYFIKKKNIRMHMIFIMLALFFTGIFLILYLIYHFTTPPTEFGGEGPVRYLYFLILITHISLAAVILPLVMFTLIKAIQKDFFTHRKVARYTFPLWLYVSITGVLIYLFNSPYY